MKAPDARIAQLVEQATENRCVGSSNLSPGTTFAPKGFDAHITITANILYVTKSHTLIARECYEAHINMQENIMGRNLGNIDRIIRLIVGVLALAYAFFTGLEMGSLTQIIAAVVGVIMVGTSAMKFCPLYRIFGLRSCPIENN